MEYGDELYISGSNNGGVIDRDLFCRPIDFDYPLIHRTMYCTPGRKLPEHLNLKLQSDKTRQGWVKIQNLRNP